jgi:Tfp pilus assembly protein PilF
MTTDRGTAKTDRAERRRQATAWAQSGQQDQAEELLQQLLEEDDSDIRAWDLLGFVRWSQGNFAGAEECCHQSLARKPLGAYARKGLGVCLASQGRLEEGIVELHQAMALKPTWVDPVHDLAMVLWQAERYDQALPYLERALSMAPQLEVKLRPMIRRAQQVGGQASAEGSLEPDEQ